MKNQPNLKGEKNSGLCFPSLSVALSLSCFYSNVWRQQRWKMNLDKKWTQRKTVKKTKKSQSNSNSNVKQIKRKEHKLYKINN